jgi:hypothetical protein
MRPRKCWTGVGRARFDWIFGLAPNVALRRQVGIGEKQGRTLQAVADPRKQRRFTQFYDAAGSWGRLERIIAHVEAGPRGAPTQGGRARPFYGRLHCPAARPRTTSRGGRNRLAADPTSCHAAEANPSRLVLHAGAYWLLW